MTDQLPAPPPTPKPKSHTTDHLANERTFLAWVRTSIATISLGFVVARFSFWLREIARSTGSDTSAGGLSLPVGLVMVAFGAALALFGAWRYQQVRRAIENDLPHPHSTGAIIISTVLVLLAVALIIYLLLKV